MTELPLNKITGTGLVALLLSGSTLVGAASAVAADLGPYATDEEAILERQPVRTRIVVEKNHNAPLKEHHVIKRRIVEGYEGPALVPPQYLPTITVQGMEIIKGLR